MKKAAMFGLDARIALAIFGALSVISGAALYSAIEQSKLTAQLVSYKEIEKAIEQYYLDTGSLPPLSTTTSTTDLSAYALVEKPSGVTGWNGPYLSYEKYASGDALMLNGSRFALMYKEPSNSLTGTCTKSSAECMVFIWYGKVDLAFGKKMNEFIDNEDSTASSNYTGLIQYYLDYHAYKTALHFNPANSPNT
tara:strand:+ start:1775 stop:2356 length:582 start_codon:yes stop_codon:yes gene_type:complete